MSGNNDEAKELNPFNPLYTDEITYISNIEMLKGKELFEKKKFDKLEIISVSDVFGESIKRIVDGRSLSSLFNK